MAYIVKFENVGRNNKTWSVKMNEIDEYLLIKEVVKSKALMSKGIDVVLEEGKEEGIIYAGFRNVGKVSYMTFNHDVTDKHLNVK